tara:strand:- start:418 stop:654 length:237 start_codon:yes stop_codon:yes gene_type:complete
VIAEYFITPQPNRESIVDIVKKTDTAYYFSHDTITKMESGEIRFIDANGAELKVSYFGAGLGGMNGIFKPSPTKKVVA